MTDTTASAPGPGTALAHRHGHLLLHRRLILVRSMAAGFAGLIPVPVLDEWAAAVIRRTAVRRIAETRRVDLDEEAVRVLADGETAPPSWRALASSTALTFLMRRTLRKLLVVVALARRTEEIARTYAVLTLVDHYCARLHVGHGLDVADARELRAAIDQAVASTRGHVLLGAVRRGLLAAGRTAVQAPFEILDALSGGSIRRLLARGDEAAAAEVVEEAVAQAATRQRGFLARATQTVDEELGRAGTAFVDELVAALEASPALERLRRR